jgi:enamine deaminase RidA (YjgF/YER057c/UK114 family)
MLNVRSKLLALQGATMNDVVRIVTYITDIRFFQDALKCRKEAFGDTPIPASTLLNVPQTRLAVHDDRS